MASTIEFVTYVCAQIRGTEEITYKKMFGEYTIYCNDKIIGLICENQLFIKQTESGKKLLSEVIEGSPYTGAKAHFLLESLEDREELAKFIRATYEELPEPKPKKKKLK